MRISLADSRSNGFKRWSDAQRPAAAEDDEEIQEHEGPRAIGVLHAGERKAITNMQSTKNKAKPNPPNTELRQKEAAKTSRLRALRLAKEAEVREAAARAAAANPPKAALRRRVRAAADAVAPDATKPESA